AGNGPFSYYSQPTGEIGVMDAPSGTEISPEGFLYTGYGELMFFTGNPEVPIHERVKTLLRGYLPVVLYDFTRDGVRYSFEAFAATLDGTPSGTQVDFIRVQAENTTQEPRVAWLSSGMRYEGTVNSADGVANNRFARPAEPGKPGDYSQPGVAYSARWTYGSSEDAIERDGQVLYYFSQTAPHTVRYTLEAGPRSSGTLQPYVLKIGATTPVGIVRYELPLKPGQTVSLDWKLPVIPVDAGSPAAARIESAGFDEYLSRTVDGWERILGQGMSLSVPETKVDDAFRASLVYDLIARNKIGDDYVQTVNDLQYHAFWLRDASFITRMYDATGYRTTRVRISTSSRSGSSRTETSSPRADSSTASGRCCGRTASTMPSRTTAILPPECFPRWPEQSRGFSRRGNPIRCICCRQPRRATTRPSPDTSPGITSGRWTEFRTPFCSPMPRDTRSRPRSSSRSTTTTTQR
ncbi:MAG: hypothetical protein WCC14_16260, partial [Acidobacteriaceae bacterium]